MSRRREMGRSTALAFLLIGVAGTLHAADGATLYKTRACHSCHGDDAKTTVLPSYPKLAGQNADYLFAQMQAIRDGTRTNGLAPVMRPLMSAVSDEEFRAISEYLATLN